MFAVESMAIHSQREAVPVEHKDIASWLRAYLNSANWTQADLARRMDASTGAVAHWVSGSRIPNPDTVRRLADTLHADADYLLTLAGHRPPDPYFDPDSPEAKLLPYIRAIEWDERSLGLVIAQLKQLVEFQGKKRNN